tara:strand:+ start:5956 stop:6102 length:147 start_codon:yes stop_codon:yes gene_type:complete
MKPIAGSEGERQLEACSAVDHPVIAFIHDGLCGEQEDHAMKCGADPLL